MRVAVALNGLTGSDVRVEFVAHRVLPKSRMSRPPLSSYREESYDDAWRVVLQPTLEIDASGATIYELDVTPQDCGTSFAFEIRVYPWHELLTQPFELGLLKRL